MLNAAGGGFFFHIRELWKRKIFQLLMAGKGSGNEIILAFNRYPGYIYIISAGIHLNRWCHRIQFIF